MIADIRVLLLDDHPAILDGLGGYLDQQPGIKVVSRHTAQAEALAALTIEVPDVAIVDIKVGGGFGFAFGAKARECLPTIKLLFITGYDDDVFLEKAFEAGGLGLVLKSEPLTEMVTAVRHVAKGERFVSLNARGRFHDSGNARQPGSARLAVLTAREREVLHHVSQGKSAKEISAILAISAWTVTNHKANIMAKLDIHNQVGLARFALETGLSEHL